MFGSPWLVHKILLGKCDGSNGCCQGQCGQAEGDCDWDSDCLPGLICESGGWLATDYCKAGNGIWTFLIFKSKIFV